MLSVVDLCRTSPFDNDEQFIYLCAQWSVIEQKTT